MISSCGNFLLYRRIIMRHAKIKPSLFHRGRYEKEVINLICSGMKDYLLQKFHTYNSMSIILTENSKTPENIEQKNLWKLFSKDILSFPASSNTRHVFSKDKKAVYILKNETEINDYKIQTEFSLTHHILNNSLNLQLNFELNSQSIIILDEDLKTFKDFYPYTINLLKTFWNDCLNIESKFLSFMKEKIPSFKNTQIAATSIELIIKKFMVDIPYSITYKDLYMELNFEKDKQKPLKIFYVDFLKKPSSLTDILKKRFR